MSLSRKQYVAVCQTCVNRKFDSKVGLLCSLTNEYAAFDTVCQDFNEDPLAVKRIDRMQKHNEEALTRSINSGNAAPLIGSEKQMLSSGFWGGLLMIIGGLAWLIAGYAFDFIFYYPIFLILGGIYVVIKAGVKKSQDLTKQDTSDILDDEFK